MTVGRIKKEQANEERMVGLVRNALVIAGQEMGEDGDHWPVIKSTIQDIMQTWENVKIERAVDAEMKKHLYQRLENMENGVKECSAELQAKYLPKLKELREVYDAYFSAVPANPPSDDTEVPPYLKRAEAIIATLGENDV